MDVQSVYGNSTWDLFGCLILMAMDIQTKVTNSLKSSQWADKDQDGYGDNTMKVDLEIIVLEYGESNRDSILVARC